MEIRNEYAEVEEAPELCAENIAVGALFTWVGDEVGSPKMRTQNGYVYLDDGRYFALNVGGAGASEVRRIDGYFVRTSR